MKYTMCYYIVAPTCVGQVSAMGRIFAAASDFEVVRRFKLSLISK